LIAIQQALAGELAASGESPFGAFCRSNLNSLGTQDDLRPKEAAGDVSPDVTHQNGVLTVSISLVQL
jgi:hypothetical protein